MSVSGAIVGRHPEELYLCTCEDCLRRCPERKKVVGYHQRFAQTDDARARMRARLEKQEAARLKLWREGRWP